MEQKQVQIIGFKANGYKSIETVVLTPDLLQGKLIRIVGEIGNGKSSLMELMQIALSGSEAVAKKETLKSGFIAEVQIADGDHKLFMGAKVREITRGANKGELIFETFLYEKDMDGKTVIPIIDGRRATAQDYMSILHTEITFNTSALFSNNQAEHRKLIEKLFSAELNKLGIDTIIERIAIAKKRQDNSRAICDANGAFRATFEEEGYEIETLETLSLINIEQLQQEIITKEIEKDRILRQSEDAKALFEEKAKAERETVLREIRDKISSVTESIRKRNEHLLSKYNEEHKLYLSYLSVRDDFRKINNDVVNWNIGVNAKNKIIEIVDLEKKLVLKEIDEPIQPMLVPINNNIPDISNASANFSDLVQERLFLLDEYKKKQSEPTPTFVATEIDTTEIDVQLSELKFRHENAKINNNIVSRFEYWKTWIEAKGLYEKEIDTLRKLYEKVNTGVTGMIIEPVMTNSGRIETWLKYNGIYDSEFFGNLENEMRYLFDYSAFQRSIIGLKLQSVRLNLKPKALRMAFIDDISVTKKSIEILTRICDELDLRLWTTYAKDNYDIENIPDGEIVVEGGHIFFNQQNL